MNENKVSLGCSVQNLQTMLRTICSADKKRAQFTVSGTYDHATANEIRELQKHHGMPTTGITDESTWETVCADYEEAKRELQCAESLTIPLKCGEVVRRGENHPAVLLAQAILKMLSEACENFAAPEVTGTLDLITAEGLEAVQMMADLPITGELDKKTWKILASHFTLAAERKIKASPLPRSDCYRP